MTVTLSPLSKVDSSKSLLLLVDHGFSYEHLANLPGDVAGVLKDHLKEGEDVGKKDSITVLPLPHSMSQDKVIVACAGPADKLSLREVEDLGGQVEGYLQKEKAFDTVVLNLTTGKLVKDEVLARFCHGVTLKHWGMEKYFTKKKPEQLTQDVTLKPVFEDAKKVAPLLAELDAIKEGVYATREVVTEPANVLSPTEFAERIRALAKFGLEIEILHETKLKEMGMHSLLAVGHGSVEPSYVAVMKWSGGNAKDAPLAFVGKGVCFDTGGISIKPSRGMDEMKFDMGGAAAVYGLMKTLALRKAKVNVVGVVGLVENMPSGNAQRPGDVVKSLSGQTIECLNTDAEGRMVLADALWYTKETFKPKFMVDLATLTGAILHAFADHHTGLFSNNDDLSNNILDAGLKTGEESWRLPLSEKYDKMINSPIADVANIVTSGMGAGSITAGQFLQRFVGETPWAHLDIAGTVWSKGPKALSKKGATGVGVRMLNQMIKDHYETTS